MTAPRSWWLQDLAVGYGRQPVVCGISATVQIGDMVVVSGANGSGKSCLLRTLAGELRPLAGAIHAPADFDHSVLGVVPQVTDLEPRLPTTLREMAALGATGLRGRAWRRHLQEALDLVGLQGRRASQSWRRSSGGERQRALLARALVRRPELLLMDEATSHLDTQTAQQVLTALAQRCAAGELTVIAVSHDLHLAATTATRRLHVADGCATLSEPATHG